MKSTPYTEHKLMLCNLLIDMHEANDELLDG